ncbi:MAG: GntR family transcriptional regulator [Victivallales bacterium]|jgi:DNA-binding transcriptional regulator YhcF (GntR family)
MDLGFKADVIYQKLHERIAVGQYPEGMRLPTEAELCAEFGASRNTVRAALDKLSGDDLIYKIQGSGCYVKKRSTEKSGIVSVMYHGEMDMVVKIQDMILSRNCLMSVFSQRKEGWTPEVEAAFLKQVLQQRHRGLIASCTPIQPYNEVLTCELSKEGIKLVHVEQYRTDRLPSENYLMPDYFQAGYAAASALLIAGCKSLVYATVNTVAPYRILSQSGFEAAVKQHGVKKYRLVEKADESKGLLDFIGKSNGSSGIFAAQHGLADSIRKELRKHDLQSGILSLELAGDHFAGNEAYMGFDRLGIFEKTLDFIFSDRKELKELVPPKVMNAELISRFK